MNKNFTQKGLQARHFSRNCFSWSWCFGLIFLLFSAGSYAQVANYAFSQSNGTYTAITGGTVVRSGSSLDTGGATVTLPTAFPFNGSSITSLRVNDDGYLALGVTSFTNAIVPISSNTTANGIIAALACNLMDANAIGTTPEIRWQEIGNEIIFQWNDFARNIATTSTEIFDFQIRLNTSNGEIKIVYSDFSSVNDNTSIIPQVGLRGATNSDYNARRLTTSFPDSSPAWNDTGLATSNAHNVRFTSVSPAAFPSTGLIFTYTPPAPITITPASSTTFCNGGSVDLTASSTTGYAYTWSPATGLNTTSGATVTATPTSTTTYTVTGTAGAATTTQSVTITVNPAPTSITLSGSDITVCKNTVQSITASGGEVSGATTTVSSGTVNLAIPDGSTTGVTQNLVVSTIPAGATISKVDVTLNINHAFNVDIEAYLIAPNGKIVNLIADRSGANYTNTIITSNTAATALSSGSAPFTGTFRADLMSRTNVNNFTSGIWTPTSNYTVTFTELFTVPNGTWQVRVFDDANIDTGTLVNCAITITYNGSQITWSPTTNLFTDAACTTPYISGHAATIFAKPTETTTYTATSTLGSCTKTASRTYTVASATYDPALYSGNTPANWSEAPAANKGIVINGNLATSGNLSGCNCVVQSGNVVVNSGHSLVLTNELNVAGGSVTFENNSNLVQTNPVANTGNITYKRNSSALMRLDYTLWSSPVAGQNLKAFSPNTLSPRFYIYDETSTTGNTTTNNGTYVTVLTSANESTYNFIGGKGYLIRTPNNHPTTPTVYNGVFTGVPQNGNFSFTLSNALAGYNLVGNPYPSSIDLNAFFAANAAVQSTVWFWRKSNGAVGDGYVTANNLGYTFPGQTADGATNIAIRSGQGFFVKATGAGSVSFNNGMRSTNSTSTFFRNTASEMPSRVWLQVANSEEVLASALVGYTSAATLGEDAGFDSKPFGNKASLVSLIGTEGYAIQGRSSFEVTDQVALGFEAATAGNYSIAIANKDGVFASGQAIYLQDLAQNFTHDFASGAYNFVSGVGTFNNRFRIVYETQTLGIDDVTANNAYVYDNNGVLTVANTKEEIKAIVIYDIQGRVLINASDVNANQWKATAMTKNNQVLLVKVTTATGTSTTKTVF